MSVGPLALQCQVVQRSVPSKHGISIVVGKFRGVIAAVVPTGSLMPMMRRSLCGTEIVSPQMRRAPSADRSMNEAAQTISPLASRVASPLLGGEDQREVVRVVKPQVVEQAQNRHAFLRGHVARHPRLLPGLAERPSISSPRSSACSRRSGPS